VTVPTQLIDPALPVVECARVPIVACRPLEAADEVIRLATGDLAHGIDVHLCNAYTIALADDDPVLFEILTRAGLNFPDGKSVVWANRLRYRGRGLPSDRVYGPDLMLNVMDRGREHGLKHYLLGSTEPVLRGLEAALDQRCPGIDIVGVESPPFRLLTEDESAEQAKRILQSEAEIVWVGLGTPKQDVEIARLAQEVSAVHLAVGAAFDFVSGNKRQAPAWVGRAGLEWAYRLRMEPRRLWRRYAFGNLAFMRAILRWSVESPGRARRGTEAS
jgi:N-acetylglucosaminyldiphosphoundecaprenol N-acetyl-beta-D-mannosaminyltransferase